MPTLVVVGEQDTPFLAPSRAMADAIPGAELVVLPDAGHSPQFEAPEAWWDAVSGFLDAVLSPAPPREVDDAAAVGRVGRQLERRHHHMHDRAVADDDAPGPWGRFGVALAGIAAVGLGVRVAAVMAWYRHLPLGPTDNYFYWAQAKAVARGAGYINPFEAGEVASAAHPPLYSTYLAVFARVGLDSPLQFRLASCLLGLATIVVIGITARRIAGDRAGLVAAGVAAVFPPLWIADGTLVSESCTR